ncbi:GCN5-related N-acetyltransferase [Aurantiacibacter aquimixticola]|uniref:GCN5-related N-acetyltransferase n=1 Tax=Aurantiacibacter aquimixticola TaxID=1958945 RepID=UPI001F5B981C|nr:GCN5-related N-acetyltransferase [Aurantiacibacter aquimixticola]
MTDRDDLQARWFALTRERMPVAAPERHWPVRFDHCFQRILLDNACGQPWREAIDAPAYRNASDELLERAIALGEAALGGSEDLPTLNRRSLEMRGKLRR